MITAGNGYHTDAIQEGMDITREIVNQGTPYMDTARMPSEYW